MKKVAVLYYGLHQGYCFNECFLNFQKAVIEPNKDEYTFDIFMHRWIEDKNTKDWLPWYNSDKVNKKAFSIDKDFLKSVVKPKVLKCEPFIDFSKKEYHKILGVDDCVYKYNQLYSKKLKKYIIYNVISREYSINKVNELRKKYENDNNFKYDIICILESNTYLFQKINLKTFNIDILNIWGFWPFEKKIPNYFKTKAAGHIQVKGIYDCIVISNNLNIDKFCSLFDNLNKYTHRELPKCDYKKFDYLQNGYLKYIHLNEMEIQFKNIELIGGILRYDGVKININICPQDKLELVNSCQRKDGKKLSKDARDYIDKL